MLSEPEVLAVIGGQPFTDMPADLFIPPDALEVLLDSFTGPLDLLLYLIRRHNIDILDIPMAMITEQYMQYIHLLEEQRMGLAADYLVMAAVLIEIKSRLLLPTITVPTDEIEEDPRMALVRRLQEYEQFKEASLRLDELTRLDRDVFHVCLKSCDLSIPVVWPEVLLSDLKAAMLAVLKREDHKEHHQISREILSVSSRMTELLDRLQHEKWVEFTRFLKEDEGRMGVVVTFLAVLELVKQSLVSITQASNYSQIHLYAGEINEK